MCNAIKARKHAFLIYRRKLFIFMELACLLLACLCRKKGKYLDSNQELTIPQIATLPIELYLPYKISKRFVIFHK